MPKTNEKNKDKALNIHLILASQTKTKIYNIISNTKKSSQTWYLFVIINQSLQPI
jgi:hypothetical protein